MIKIVFNMYIFLMRRLPRWFSGKESCLTMRETWVRSLGQEGPLGVGNGNPFQYSCLENSMNRGDWWAIVHGFTKSPWQYTFHMAVSHFHINSK